MRLLGKKAIITGGSNGIGKTIALGFAKEGADIVISYNTNQKTANEIVNEVVGLKRKALLCR